MQITCANVDTITGLMDQNEKPSVYSQALGATEAGHDGCVDHR